MEQFIQSYTMLTKKWGLALCDSRPPDETSTETAAVVSNTFLLECSSPRNSKWW